MQDFKPDTTLLFDLYNKLRTKLLFWFVHIMSELGSTSGGFQWRGSTPAGFQEAVRAACIYMYIFRYMYIEVYIRERLHSSWSFDRCATHCIKVLHSATLCDTLQLTAAHCNTLQHTADVQRIATNRYTLRHSVTHCNSLQHTAAHCNTLQHTATHCRCAMHCNQVLHSATPCDTLQLTAAHCNTLQHTAAHCNTLPIFDVRSSSQCIHPLTNIFTYI